MNARPLIEGARPVTSTLPHLIVVDVETSGLSPIKHDVLEVAAIDLTTGDELHFVPSPIFPEWLKDADPGAMRVNRYFERGVYAHQVDVKTTRKRWEALGTMLDGNILAGVNPAFDARFVDAAMEFHEVVRRRRYQLRDLATYAAGVLGIDPAEPTSSSEIFTALEVENQDAHSALGDARATAQAFNVLRSISLERK
jgi:DNA polymerase-3 subunit epsilon